MKSPTSKPLAIINSFNITWSNKQNRIADKTNMTVDNSHLKKNINQDNWVNCSSFVSQKKMVFDHTHFTQI